MVPSVTIDGGLLRETPLSPALLRLRQWENEGRLALFESDRSKQEVGVQAAPVPQPARRPGWTHAKRKVEQGSVSFHQLSTILFPTRDPHRLNMGEVNDVAHLRHHHTRGHTIFITPADSFAANNKRERLQSAFGIIVLSPNEAVLALERIIVKTKKTGERGPNE